MLSSYHSVVNVGIYSEMTPNLFLILWHVWSQQKHSFLGFTASSEECTVFGTKPLLTPSQPSWIQISPLLISSYMSLVKIVKDSSTFVASFAEVSIYFIPQSADSFSASSLVTWRREAKSHLCPTSRNTIWNGCTCIFASSSQSFTCSKDRRLVMSNTKNPPTELR